MVGGYINMLQVIGMLSTMSIVRMQGELRMATFRDNFYERNKVSVGEEKCEEFLNSKGMTYLRYGFDVLDKVSRRQYVMIPDKIRNTPDFMVMHNRASLLEAKCCKNDHVRIKFADIQSYNWWNKQCSLNVFIYNIKRKEHLVFRYDHLKDLAIKYGEIDKYHDNNKEYYKIHWDKLSDKVYR